MCAERHQNTIELSPALVQSYAATFIQRYDRYPLQRDDGTYTSVASPLHMSILEGHLKGHVTIGAYALNELSETSWLCFDADTPNDWLALIQLSDSLAFHHTPSYLEQSRPERGGHLWLFLPFPLSGTDARRLGKQLLASLQTTTLELYPKQDQLRTGSGSLVRLPLGIHKLTRRRYHFIHPDGTPLAPTIREQIALLAHPNRLSPEHLTHILSLAPPAEPHSPTNPFKKRPKNRIVGATPSERIKNRISVYDFVSQFVELNASGKGLCPFHDDHIYSFSVNSDGNYWHCFAGCGGGSVIDFWMRWRKLKGQDNSFKKSVTELAKMLL